MILGVKDIDARRKEPESNPIHYLLEKYPNVQKGLSEQYRLRIEYKSFKENKDPYFLIDIPVANDLSLNLNGKQMRVVSHHFTVPKHIQKGSRYHYTVNLRDTESKEYRVHVYYDKLDRVNLEPTLFSFTNKDGQEHEITAIDQQGRDQLLNLALPQTNIIMKLKEYQSNVTDILLKLAQEPQNKLASLREHIPATQTEYIQLAQKQIDLIQQLESLGNKTYTQDRKFYQMDIEFFNQGTIIGKEIEKEPAPNELRESDETVESAPVEACSSPSTSITLKSKSQQNSKILVSRAAAVIEEYGQYAKDPVKQHAILQKIFDILAIFHASDEYDPQIKSEVLILKAKLKGIVIQFFSKVDLLLHEDFVTQALQLGILPFDNQLLEKILKADKASFLQKLLNMDLFTEASVYALGNDGKKYTLVEWCIRFESVNCFVMLSNARFSLDYISEHDTPLLSLINDQELYGKFAINLNLSLSTLNRLMHRLTSMLREKIKSTNNEDAKKRSEAQIKLMVAYTNFRNLLKRKPSFENILRQCDPVKQKMAMIERVGIDKYLKYADILKNHTDYLLATAEFCEEVYSCYSVLTPEQLKLINFNSTVDSIDQELVNLILADKYEAAVNYSIQAMKKLSVLTSLTRAMLGLTVPSSSTNISPASELLLHNPQAPRSTTMALGQAANASSFSSKNEDEKSSKSKKKKNRK
ncbi:MAG: hypothetical protein JSR17_08585 [Proteobacteria bacterium]|nr:hypothetical protein [Pseudomonadota bacterium]